MKIRETVLTVVGIVLAGLTVADVSAQSFVATYGFGSVVANSGGTTDPTTPPTVTGLTFGSFTSVGASGNPNAGGRFSFTSQPLGGVANSDDFSQFTGSLTPTVYFEVTLTPLGSIAFQIDSVSFDMRRSGTGVRSYAVRSSVDGFTANLPASISPGNPNLGVGPGNELRWLFDATSNAADQTGSLITPGPTHVDLTSPVTFRFYGWNAEGTGGTFSLDNVSFLGSTTVPEPSVAAFLALGLGTLSLRRRRSFKA